MLRSFSALTVAGVLLAGCGETPVLPAKSEYAVEDLVVNEPIRFENLTIFPVSSRTPKTEDRFLTLDEGLKSGVVEIRELTAASINAGSVSVPSVSADDDAAAEAPASALDASGTDEGVPSHDSNPSTADFDANGNDVNSLVVINRSDKPLYLMPGEIIIGGSQDRTIAEELVIAANCPPTKVPVFCVEHGRWGAKGTEESVSQFLSSASEVLSTSVAIRQTQSIHGLAEQADQGQFVASIGQLSKKARVAVQADKDQSTVWENIAAANGESGVAPDSGAFTANYCDPKTLQRLEPYVQKLQDSVASQDRVVGVLVAIDGKIESIDVFESTPLFQKVWPKLLKSYALDASNSHLEAGQQPIECTRTAAMKFFTDAIHADVTSNDSANGIALTRRDSKHVISFTSKLEGAADAAPAGAMGGMGGMGGGVHFSGFSK